MPNFVVLHDWLSDVAYRLRADTITRFNRSIDGHNYTIVITDPGGSLGVRETPAEIEAAINIFAKD